ncbi:MAG: phosphoribulokinase [Mycobacteriales bacterium]
MTRSQLPDASSPRPVMLAISGDSASGKTTLARGLVEALGPERCTALCVDDYHRYDRLERKELPFTPLHPDCNYIDIMEQHLQILAMGQPILKPVYEHATGMLIRPEYIEPKQFVIVEGLFPLYTKLSRACCDISVFLDPPEEIRREWKIKRDCSKRGYTREQVVDELQRREPESTEFIRPQRRQADIVVRFAPISTRNDPPDTPLSAKSLLWSTIQHPPLSDILTDDVASAMHLKIIRDVDGTPVDRLHVHGHAEREESQLLQKEIWDRLAGNRELPQGLGELTPGQRSEPLAVTQLLLLYHLVQEVYEV